MKHTKILGHLKIVSLLISIFILNSAQAETACLDTSSVQTITAGSDVVALVALSTTEWNVGMTIDQTSYSKIVVPSDGLYRITGFVSFYNIPDGKHTNVGIALNGTASYYLASVHSGATDTLVVGGATVLNLTANTALSLFVQCNSNNYATCSGIGAKMTVEKIQPGRLTACLNNTSSQSVAGSDTDVKATLPNAAWNVGMAVDTTNSTITVPTSGRYRITGYGSYINMPDGKHAHAGVSVNGSVREYLQVGIAGATDWMLLSGSTVLTLSANDVITLHLQHDNSSAISTFGCQLVVEAAD